jgi:hypothetical protein
MDVRKGGGAVQEQNESSSATERDLEREEVKVKEIVTLMGWSTSRQHTTTLLLLM